MSIAREWARANIQKELHMGTKKTKSKKKASTIEAPETVVEEIAPAANNMVDAVEANQAAEAVLSKIEAAAKKTKKKSSKKGEGATALADAFDGFARHLEDSDKSPGTVFSYQLELKLALEAFGAETKLDDLTVERVAEFFGSARVTQTRSGRPKSQLSIDKTRRVLRQALLWAVEQGLIASAPIPAVSAARV